jgi:hypothetical protein
VGDYAEAAFLKEGFTIREEHPRGRCHSLPFLCTTGDFIITRGNTSVCVEVKSRSSQSEASGRGHLKEFLTQLWVTMDILGYNTGELYVYALDRKEGGRVNSCELVRVVQVTRKQSFIEEFSEMLIHNYVHFLKTYYVLLSGGLEPGVSEIKNAIALFKENFARNKGKPALELKAKAASAKCKKFAIDNLGFSVKASEGTTKVEKCTIMSKSELNAEMVFESVKTRALSVFDTGALRPLPVRSKSVDPQIFKRRRTLSVKKQEKHYKAFDPKFEKLLEKAKSVKVTKSEELITNQVDLDADMMKCLTTLYHRLPF